jgi:nicotinate-nucleotide--dimethylbenzimidazole phosphoribosyltransferase
MDIGDRTIKIAPLDKASMERARERQDNLTKPPGSLGRLEDISIAVCGMTGLVPPDLAEKSVILCAGDHGVTEEGVSPYPSEVTAQMLMNFASGGAAINVLARHAGARVVLVDVGCACEVRHPGIIDRRVRQGTANFTRGPAMTRQEAEAAVVAGLDVAAAEIERGSRLIATGDMGIGNTTASSALIAALTGLPPRAVAGRGTGLDDAGLERKIAVIERGLEVNDPSAGDPLEVLAAVGGLEIGALAGVMLGCAQARVPVVVDGFISGAAALLAARLYMGAEHYMIASHLSVEPGHRAALDEIGLVPFLDLNMYLGEGTGAVLAMSVIEASVKVLAEMATFDEAGVSRESENVEK